MCHGVKCSLPICSYRPEPALGHSRQKPSVRGRDEREREHFAANPNCAECGVPAAAVHHVGGRKLGGWRRKTAELRSLCRAHHELAHGLAG